MDIDLKNDVLPGGGLQLDLAARSAVKIAVNQRVFQKFACGYQLVKIASGNKIIVLSGNFIPARRARGRGCRRSC